MSGERLDLVNIFTGAHHEVVTGDSVQHLDIDSKPSLLSGFKLEYERTSPSLEFMRRIGQYKIPRRVWAQKRLVHFVGRSIKESHASK